MPFHPPYYLRPLAAFGLLVVVVVIAVVVPRLVRLNRDELRVLAALQVSAAGAWLMANRPFEGTVLLSFSTHNGLTVADLLTLPPLANARWLLRLARRQA